MQDMIWPAIGIAAALLTATSFIPQLVICWRHPGQARVAFITIFQFMLGAMLWAAYGIHLQDWIIIGANIFIISNLLAIAAVQWWQEKNKISTTETG